MDCADAAPTAHIVSLISLVVVLLGLTFFGLGWQLGGDEDDTGTAQRSERLGIALVIGNQRYQSSAWPELHMLFASPMKP